MSDELYWLTATALATGLFWSVYVLNRFVEIGLIGAMKNSGPSTEGRAEWAARAKKAHRHAVENLAVFAPLALAVHVTGSATAATSIAATIYFFAQLIHFTVYTLGVPGIRTTAFLVAFGCQMTLGLTVLGIL